MFCTWLVAYCKVRDIDNDFIKIPYKKPYIEMYEDIRNGISEGDFSVEQITIFFEETSDLLFRDCKDCENSEEIRTVAFATRAGTMNYNDGQCHDKQLSSQLPVLPKLIQNQSKTPSPKTKTKSK